VNAARSVARLTAAIVILAAALGGLVTAGWFALDRLLIVHSSEGKCWRYGDHDCWDLSPAFISRVTGIALPDGTLVRDSQTGAWLSWRLSATVVLPSDEQLPVRLGQADGNIKLVGHSRGRPVCKILLVQGADEAPWPTPQ
jgi:hypothetical protein